MEKTPRNVVILGLVSMFTDMASAMVTPILPLFLVLVLHEGVDKVGLVVAIAALVSYLLRFIGGALSDRFDRNKPLLILGYGLSALAKPVFAFAASWQSIAAIRSTERIGKALRAAPKDKLIGLSAKQGKEGTAFSFHKSLDVAGEFLGLGCVLLALMFLGASEEVFRTIFLASLLPGIIAVLVLYFGVRDIRGGVVKRQIPVFRVEPALRLNLLLFCAVTVFMFSETFFVLKANSHGFSVTTIIVFLMLMRATQVILSYRVGKLIDQFSSQYLLSVAFILGLISMLLLLSASTVALVMAFVLFGLCDVIMLNAIRSFISKTAKEKGTAFGAFYFIYAISSAAGAVLIGFIWSTFGEQVAVIYSSLGVLIFGTIHFLISRKSSAKISWMQ